jgi:hypothetical protein
MVGYFVLVPRPGIVKCEHCGPSYDADRPMLDGPAVSHTVSYKAQTWIWLGINSYVLYNVTRYVTNTLYRVYSW